MFRSPRLLILARAFLRPALAVAFLFLAVSTLSGAQAPPEPQPSSVPRGELSRLRFAVLPDLMKAVATFENSPRTRDVSEEWKQCKFTPIRLGALGPAIVVEWNPLKAPNASMINIYVPRSGAYRLLLAGSGFGPTVLPGPSPVPDLVFGGTVGVCHARYSRYHYQNEHYDVDACDQETEDKSGSCAITACEHRKLPTFPNPFPD